MIKNIYIQVWDKDLNAWTEENRRYQDLNFNDFEEEF